MRIIIDIAAGLSMAGVSSYGKLLTGSVAAESFEYGTDVSWGAGAFLRRHRDPESRDARIAARKRTTKGVAMDDKPVLLDAGRIETAVHMLKTYLGDAELAPLIAAMETLARTPGDAAARARVESAFGTLGIRQGAVLTYAPYLLEILTGDPFGEV